MYCTVSATCSLNPPSGRVCTVTGKRLCYMNTASDEVIRSLFFNKHNQHLITVSVYSSDNYTSLRCRTTSLECVPERCCIPVTTPQLPTELTMSL